MVGSRRCRLYSIGYARWHQTTTSSRTLWNFITGVIERNSYVLLKTNLSRELNTKFVCVLVYKCLHQAAPTYLAELCMVSESTNLDHLRSAARGDLAVPRSRTTRYAQRCFAVSGPTLWNSLPLSVRDPSLTMTRFCARLKTVFLHSRRGSSYRQTRRPPPL